MRMFLVPQGTTVQVIKDGKDWTTPNFVEHDTRQDNLFSLEEICVDPTGIGSSHAAVPGHKTIGSAYAQGGFYGFRRDGFALLVPGHKVRVL